MAPGAKSHIHKILPVSIFYPSLHYIFIRNFLHGLQGKKPYNKDSEKEAKAFIKLLQQEFSCPSDAKRQLDKFVKKLKYMLSNNLLYLAIAYKAQ
ncbi:MULTISPECIES: hypothetical protein [unclassified Neochlamydia]|uniref:hypothetical protein n=1 Tax=unclassified Neochlamydia TaxID=2643326 RepID=UPI0014084223|nr:MULTISPECIES: hypothetical protein [unclassified Neochlamydia]MBS4167089.1 hypothetical protein [Neochlamydia sp. AcF65]MBS4170777.1 hypothetical protein [Neochlamydia sp. AcF95]NGY95717.1 hypothetical protein [Neochlamydia sp. AcF84]